MHAMQGLARLPIRKPCEMASLRCQAVKLLCIYLLFLCCRSMFSTEDASECRVGKLASKFTWSRKYTHNHPSTVKVEKNVEITPVACNVCRCMS